jgi:hypothetical protein
LEALAQPEMIIALRSPLSNRRTGNALYYRVADIGSFLPSAGGWPGTPSGLTGPHELNLNGQGFRAIQWGAGLGQGAAGRYLLIGGPTDGGPFEEETWPQKFSLYSWTGSATSPPTKLIDDLRPYTLRPEGLTLALINNQNRILFVEDRFLATGYGTRNIVHWPLSILGTVP